MDPSAAPRSALATDAPGNLDALRDVLANHPYDVLLPTHEQLVAVARHREEFRGLVPGLAVPDFDAVRRVQDKSAAVRLLTELDLPQPETALVADERALLAPAGPLPAYVKLPIATGSRGVWLARDAADLARIAAEPAVRACFATGAEILVQRPAPGPLVMIQALFDRGAPVGLHAVVRRREGVQGSAAAKESVVLPDVEAHLTRLGAALAWHGPLSLDAVLDERSGSVRYIDLNARLVEPVNAELAGADLVRRWLAVSLGEPTGPMPAPRTGVRTHMLLMALVRQAEVGRGRRAVLRELADAARGRGFYDGSTEELCPVGSDPGAAPVAGLITACLLVSPPLWQRLAGTGVPAHALTLEAWRELVAA